MAFKLPILFINFKTYENATGKKALKLARIAESVSKETKRSIALVVQATDISMIASTVKLPTFAQHVDAVEHGPYTGAILPEAVKQAGAAGTVLNHAENKRENPFLEQAIIRAETIGLSVMCCAENEQRAKEIASFSVKPTFIAVEPPELIGGNISVSTARPELITSSVQAIKAIDESIIVITGAGIKKTSDVRKAIELGTEGVFVASGIVNAASPKQEIYKLLQGFEEA